MRVLLLIVAIFILGACSNPQAISSANPMDLEGYEILEIPGSTTKTVRKMSADGSIIEDGQVLNGVKTGVWVTYQPGKPYPQKIITYTNGNANGPYFEFNNRGQLELKAYYKNNKLDGYWAQYSFGRPTHEATYKDGELNGVYREFKAVSGKVQKEISYKNGKMDGKYLFYDEEGNISLDYTYKNGEKVEE